MTRNREPPDPLALIERGLAALALPGQGESGDLHAVVPFPNGVLVAVVDGLGHGAEAAAAAKIAVATLQAHAHEPAIALLRRCHDALTKTRGVVMTLAQLNTLDETMTWLGVGNVEGLLLRADPEASPARESVLLRGGVVGYELPALRASVIPIARGDTLVFATDGIRSGFGEALTLSDPPQHTAERILAQYGKGTDDALVIVARWLGGAL